MIQKDDSIIRLATSEDAAGVRQLLKDVGLNAFDSEAEFINHWRLLWDENPFYKTFNDPIAYGRVIEYNNKIVGFFGNIQRVYLLHSEKVPVSVGTRWVIEKSFRKHSLKLCELYFKENKYPLKVGTTGVKVAAKIYKPFGGHKIPVPELQIVYMIPINIFKIGAHKVQKPILKSVLQFLNTVVPWSFQYKLIKSNKKISKFDIATPPSDFDSFLSDFCMKQKGLIAFRSAEIIKWHSSVTVGKFEKEHFIYTDENKTVAYASIIKELIEDSNGLIRFKITDLIAETSKVKKAMIKELIKHASQNKGDVLEIHHHGMIDKKEIPTSFVMERKYAYFPFNFQTPDKALTSFLKDRSNWHISPFDGDTGL